MIQWLQQLFSFESQVIPWLPNWVVHVFLIVLATVTFNFCLRLLFRRLQRKAKTTENLWDDAVVAALKRPVLLAIWVIGISLAAEVVEAVSHNEVFQYAGMARSLAVIVLLMMFLLRLIRNVEKTFLLESRQDEKDVDATTVRIVARLLRMSVMITGVLVLLQTMGVSVAGVLAFGGIGGIAIGFAAKDLLANFFGGIIIYLDRPFRVGDWIRSPDRAIEGVVEDIRLRLTVIRTFDKRPLYVPNATFTTIAVENPSRMNNRRIYEKFGLRYSDSAKMEAILADVRAMLADHEELDRDLIQMANFDALAASSLDFFIYAFTRTTDWATFHQVKEDVLLKVIDIIHQHGADVAFPTRTLDGLDPVLEKLDRKAGVQEDFK